MSQKHPDGFWPKPRHRVFFDLRSAKKAPANDGAVAPPLVDPDWLPTVAPSDLALEQARRGHEQAVTSAKTAEEKAARLLQLCLALLTISFAVAKFQIDAVHGRTPIVWAALLPVAVAAACLTAAALGAAEVDRVGFYHHPGVEALSGRPVADQLKELVTVEAQGERMARWTANRKATDVMDARAWFTRGLLALIAAGLVSVGLSISPAPVEEDEPLCVVVAGTADKNCD